MEATALELREGTVGRLITPRSAVQGWLPPCDEDPMTAALRPAPSRLSRTRGSPYASLQLSLSDGSWPRRLPLPVSAGKSGRSTGLRGTGLSLQSAP